MSDELKLFKVTIDGQTVEVPPGTNVLQAGRMLGKEVAPPAMCYYSKLKTSGGKCRTCLVEVSKGSDADPRPMPKLVASCRTTVMDGMEVKNYTSERVLSARRGVVEFLLINHPLDCPVCDQAGECKLQDLDYDHGPDKSRYDFPRRTFAYEDFGPYIQMNMNRCILCYRCVHTANELTTNERRQGVMHRGDHAEISTYIRESLEGDFIGNIIDVCPVGALTDKTYRFKNRVWFLKPIDAHRDCPTCCGKVQLWARGDEVFRVTARKDEWAEVKSDKDGNTEWICNTCRFEKKNLTDWTLERPSKIALDSVIRQGHYDETLVKPKDVLEELMDRKPNILLNIHDVSEVNQPEVELSKFNRPPHSSDYEPNKKLK